MSVAQGNTTQPLGLGLSPEKLAAKSKIDEEGDSKMEMEAMECTEVDKENVVQKVDENVKGDLQQQQKQQPLVSPSSGSGSGPSSNPVEVPANKSQEVLEKGDEDEDIILNSGGCKLESIDEHEEMDDDGENESGSSGSMKLGSSFEEIQCESEPYPTHSHRSHCARDRDLEIEDILDDLEESVGSSEDTLLQDSDGVISFNMSLQKRLVELNDAFENFGQGGLSLCNFWTLYFETYVEPMGWRAMWKPKGSNSKINRFKNQEADDKNTTPENFKVSRVLFDTVEVTQVNCASLTARVRYEDDSTAFVPLSELYPLAMQENSCLSMKVTAKCIDNYRFFLNHLLFPWDSENADRWCELHLESRIQFYYDLQSGAISETMSIEVRDLIREAKVNQDKIDRLEERLGFADTEEDAIEEDVVAEMLPVHMRQEEIKSRLQMLESPLWRNMLNKLRLKQNRTSGLIAEKYILITTQSSYIQNLKADLDFIEARMEPGEKIKIISSLQEALDRCQPKATIFIKSGVHKISGLGFLEEGGSIIGLPCGKNEEPVIIEPKDAGDVWLVANSETNVTMENILVRVTPKWVPPSTGDEDGDLQGHDESTISLMNEAASSITFLTLRGSLVLKNVVIEGFSGKDGVGIDETETSGIKALEQGIVSLENCQIKNFVTGLIIREEAQLHLKSCSITGCRMGIETNPGAVLKIDSLSIQSCQKFGIIILSRSEDIATVVGDSDLLQSSLLANCGFEISNITIKDCLAGHICVCNEASVQEPEIISASVRVFRSVDNVADPDAPADEDKTL